MKKIITAAITCLILVSAQAAFAAPVQLTGEAGIKYERDTAAGEPSTAGTLYTLKLRAETGLGSGWSLYTRLGAQYATRPALADYNTAAGVYGPDRKSVIALDQFGLTRKNGKLTYKLGRQDAAVGATALLYSRPETNVGRKAFVDGLSVAGTVGAFDVSALLAQEDNAGAADNKIYALRAAYSPSENLSWGLTLGRYRNTAAATGHWAADGAYKLGKGELKAEYARSSAAANNKAYALTGSYDFDGKTALAVTAFRVEQSGDMGGQSDFDNGNKGTHYGLTYKLSDNAALELGYKDQRFLAGGQKNTKLEATMSCSF